MQWLYGLVKEKGETSHDVVNRLRRITGIKRIGHAGTLDPLATGVLVVGITREGTKRLESLKSSGKAYDAIITLGATSETDDAEGKKTEWADVKRPTLLQIKKTCASFVGIIELTPPIYSAIKIRGKAAYRYARKGKELVLAARPSKIYSIRVLKYRWPLLSIRVKTGSGVYVRSLAREIGNRLMTGAYVSELTRTRVGSYTLAKATTIDQFATLWHAQKV